VQHARMLQAPASQLVQRGFHQQLGFWPWNQDPGFNRKTMAHELAQTDKIGHGLALKAPGAQRFEFTHLRVVERVGVVRNEPRTRYAQQVLQQHLRLEPRQSAFPEQASYARWRLFPALAGARRVTHWRIHAAARRALARPAGV